MKRKAKKNYGVYLAGGPLHGEWRCFTTTPKPYLTYTVGAPGQKYKVHYTQEGELAPSYDGRQNFLYHFSGDSQ